ncbi:MAG TPA: MBL fold metallo-hydrolase [Myxococcaceae bacterium]|nr:MBL fold metallo-hydrolase [Myxococcaceae bacterium]
MRTLTWLAVLASLTTLPGLALAGDDHGHSRPDPAMIAARQKLFGRENVDSRSGQVRSDKVIFSWITNASFAASVRGRVVLLDTFVTRLEVTAGRTPLVIQDLVDLKPEALFIGHGHFDHADNAAYISKQTGATIYATPETCDNMQLDAARIFGAGTTVPCVEITSRGSIPGSELVTIHQLEPVATIKAFKHLHSTNTAPQDTSFPPVVINSPDPTTHTCVPPCNLADPRDAAMFPAGTPLSTVLNIATARTGFGGPISIYYSFRLRGDNEFTFVWHNTSGALREGCALPNNVPGTAPPQPSQPGQDAQGCFGPAVGQKLEDLMEALGPTDLEIGSVVSLGFGINGERDIVDYNTHVTPKVFIPCHTTAVAVESSSLEWKVGYAKQLDAMGIPAQDRPEVRWLVDPNDYLRPLVFDPKNPRWDKSHRHDD